MHFFMKYKLPYYMAYPMPFEYDDERKERQDLEYIKSMYPDKVKKLVPYVEDECDRMEYEGSMIFDEYPDKLGLRLMCGRVCRRIEKSGLETDGKEIRDLIEILVYQELLKRRNDRRRRRRRIY